MNVNREALGPCTSLRDSLHSASEIKALYADSKTLKFQAKVPYRLDNRVGTALIQVFADLFSKCTSQRGPQYGCCGRPQSERCAGVVTTRNIPSTDPHFQILLENLRSLMYSYMSLISLARHVVKLAPRPSSAAACLINSSAKPNST